MIRKKLIIQREIEKSLFPAWELKLKLIKYEVDWMGEPIGFCKLKAAKLSF